MVNRDVGGLISKTLGKCPVQRMLPSISRLNEGFQLFVKLLTNSELVNGNTSFVADVVIYLGKEVDLQNHIKAISSNFFGFNIFIQSKTY